MEHINTVGKIWAQRALHEQLKIFQKVFLTFKIMLKFPPAFTRVENEQDDEFGSGIFFKT